MTPLRAVLHGLFAGLIAAAFAITALALASFAHAAPSPANLGLDKTANPGNLSVQDTTGVWVEIGALNSTTHVFQIPSSSLSAQSVTVGGVTCTLGGSCAPATTVNGTSCTLGGSCTLSTAGLVVGTTATTGGAAGQIMFDDGSHLQESGALVFSTASSKLELLNNNAGIGMGASLDANLLRDGANQLAQRNGTVAQLFEVYDTFTSVATNEKAVFDWQTTPGVLAIGTEKGLSGGATLGQFEFVANGVNKGDYGVTSAGIWTYSVPVSFTSITTSGTIGSTGAISSNSGIAAVSIITSQTEMVSPVLDLSSAALTTTSGHINYGGTTAAATNCGSLAGSAGCIVMNISGTQRYVPYY